MTVGNFRTGFTDATEYSQAINGWTTVTSQTVTVPAGALWYVDAVHLGVDIADGNGDTTAKARLFVTVEEPDFGHPIQAAGSGAAKSNESTTYVSRGSTGSAGFYVNDEVTLRLAVQIDNSAGAEDTTNIKNIAAHITGRRVL